MSDERCDTCGRAIGAASIWLGGNRYRCMACSETNSASRADPALAVDKRSEAQPSEAPSRSIPQDVAPQAVSPLSASPAEDAGPRQREPKRWYAVEPCNCACIHEESRYRQIPGPFHYHSCHLWSEE